MKAKAMLMSRVYKFRSSIVRVSGMENKSSISKIEW